jgi:hypothetical protein
MRSEGFYHRGIYTKTGGGKPFWGRGNIQPASQKDTQRLPEGSRTDGVQTLFTDLQLRTVDSPNTVADRVMFNGTEYEVSTGEYWPSHNKFTLTKVKQ